MLVGLVIFAVFGILYLIVGAGLFLKKTVFYSLGVLIPLAGFIFGLYLTTIIPMTAATQALGLFLLVSDIIVVLCCSYLIINK